MTPEAYDGMLSELEAIIAYAGLVKQRMMDMRETERPIGWTALPHSETDKCRSARQKRSYNSETDPPPPAISLAKLDEDPGVLEHERR